MLTLLVTLVLTIFLAELAIMLSLPKDLFPVWGALIDAFHLIGLRRMNPRHQDDGNRRGAPVGLQAPAESEAA